MRYKKQGTFYVVQDWMVSVLDLKFTEKDVFAIIHGFSQAKDTWYTGGINYLCERINCKKTAIIEALNKLLSKNFILKTECSNGCIKYCKYASNKDLIDTLLTNYHSGTDSVPEDNNLTGTDSVFTGTDSVFTGTDSVFTGTDSVLNNKVNNKLNNKNYNKYASTTRVVKNQKDIFNITLQNKQKEIKETKKQIKNKVEQKLLENTPDNLDFIVTEKMSNLNSEEAQQNKAAAINNAVKKELAAKKKLLLHNKTARLKEAEKLFPQQDILELLDKYLDMYQTTYNIMSAVSWNNILTELIPYANNIQEIKYYIQESTTKSYRKIYPVDTKLKDNTIFHKVDEKSLHELTDQEKQEFEESLAKDENGQYLTF